MLLSNGDCGYKLAPMNATAEPRAMARPGTHEKLLSLLADEKPGQVLDVPAGQGATAAQLLKLGFQPVCLDINDANFKVPKATFIHPDMNQPFPVESERFVFVVCGDGREPFESPRHAVREMARVLKPGGKALLSFPNMLNVEQRWRLLNFGSSAH